MWKIVIALALTLGGICYGYDKVIDDYMVRTICVDGMKFVMAYDNSGFKGRQAMCIIQFLDKNGKPEECK